MPAKKGTTKSGSKITQSRKAFQKEIRVKNFTPGKTARKLLKSKQMKSAKKSRVVQSLTEKFSSAEKVTGCAKRKKESESLVETCSNQVKKKKKMSTLQKGEVAKAEQIVCSFEEINTSDSIHELRQQVSTALQGKLKRRNKHKLKDRKLVNPLGEIYIPANIAKTEDFLTFLCLRGNSSLPRSFEVFNNPDPFFTQPAHQFPDEGAMFPIQSSVTYSPPLSSAPSESSAASPMSSTDGWLVNED
ncbi:hypothetical protein OS493_004884 [Desmophyllum pertusum]|uniref:Uncharacterized protein n=1 Tax=Desmophyllum pertusum TaxID=174260 RepID=A0A9X0CT47_9CNID|nr:hypothetical protein OS493_004884 [Desmophyllum pertusum]